MSFKHAALLAAACIFSQSASALTIEAINVSTVAGYPDEHYPVSYPDYDRFSILGAAHSYSLSDGQVRESGAGWIPYTNGHLSSVSVDGGTIRYAFDQVYNWARGEGTIFYAIGQVWCPSCNESGAGMWTEGQFAPASPMVITAQLGATTATLVGTARIVSNNMGSGWGTPENFIGFASPEGAVVHYSATYNLLDGAIWDADVFDSRFSYTMNGVITLAPVPEPSARAANVLGLALLAMVGLARRHRLPGRAQQQALPLAR